SNVSGLLMGGAIFSQFFLLTLYMQQVLHYSAIKTGVAYIGLTLTIILFSGVAQALVTRVGVRRILPAGLAFSTVALVLFARLQRRLLRARSRRGRGCSRRRGESRRDAGRSRAAVRPGQGSAGARSRHLTQATRKRRA